MTVKEAFQVCTSLSINEVHMIEVIQLYIKLVKNRDVVISVPSNQIQMLLLDKAYNVARDFIIILHTAPERINVRTYA